MFDSTGTATIARGIGGKMALGRGGYCLVLGRPAGRPLHVGFIWISQEVDQSHYQITIMLGWVSLFHWEAITTAATEKPARQPVSLPACLLQSFPQNNYVPHSFDSESIKYLNRTPLNSRMQPTSGHSFPAGKSALQAHLTPQPRSRQSIKWINRYMYQWDCRELG